MSKIQRWSCYSASRPCLTQDDKGNFWGVKDVKDAYHPVLRELRKFIRDAVPYPASNMLVKRIDELLKEEK